MAHQNAFRLHGEPPRVHTNAAGGHLQEHDCLDPGGGVSVGSGVVEEDVVGAVGVCDIGERG